jgi:signal transduction histidine kinase
VVWSLQALAATVVVSTLTFGFGNIDLVSHSPLVSLAVNAAITVLVFVVMALLATALPRTMSRKLATAIVLVGLVALSAGRGAVLAFTIVATGLSNTAPVTDKVLASVFVFGPAVILSVLVIAWADRWRHQQARIRELITQREQLEQFVADSVSAHTAEVATIVEQNLQPQVLALPSMNSVSAQKTLGDLVNAVVKPLSKQLYDDFPAVNVPETKSVFVSAREFIHQSLMGRPFRPLINGAFFVIGLAPRNLSESVTVGAVVWPVAIGVVVAVGTWLANIMSARYLRQLPSAVHFLLLLLLLGVIGVVVALMPALLGANDPDQASYFLTAPVATILIAVLVGGVANARGYFLLEQAKLADLEKELARDTARARSLQWQRNRTLAAILHGSLQSALNACTIRLARAKDAGEAQAVARELSLDIDKVFKALRSPEAHSIDLQTTMLRITDTWEGVADIQWRVDKNVLSTVSGHPVSHAISDCLVETVYNAIKHQAPDHLDVTLEFGDDDVITLIVNHPGTLPTDRSEGLGTRILDYLTFRHDLTERDGIVEFRGVFLAPE